MVVGSRLADGGDDGLLLSTLIVGSWHHRRHSFENCQSLVGRAVGIDNLSACDHCGDSGGWSPVV